MAKVKKKRSSPAAFAVLLVLVCGALALALLRPKPDPAQSLNAMLDTLREQACASLPAEGGAFADAWQQCLSLRVREPLSSSWRSASGSVEATVLDAELLSDGLADEMQTLLGERAARATRRAELYGEDGAILPSLCRELYENALAARLSHAERYCREREIPVSMQFGRDGWELADEGALLALLAAPPAAPGYAESVAALEPVELHYTLPATGPGNLPDPACYGESTDPQEIMQVLQRAEAQRLIRGQKLDFDPGRDMLGRPIYYYLDETILALVWQQDEHGAIGTFAEVLIADPSQLRRKIADDTFGSYQYYYPSEFVAQTNAVLACSGDFYNSGRTEFGLTVYGGQLMRSYLSGGQSCLFDREGDMLFTYEDQFATEEEAQRFITENGVDFSLNFGPVMVDHGQDVTPYNYLLGEVLDTYARCAVGQLGKLHYLMMTINCESPDHYVYVTLRQAADSMIAHGCLNAYTLDGGQTGSILIGGRLINPVQFGAERQMSDIFYFATALPEKE